MKGGFSSDGFIDGGIVWPDDVGNRPYAWLYAEEIARWYDEL